MAEKQTFKAAALILAAGAGERAGAGLPKPYRMADGQIVLARAIAPFLAHPAIAPVCVVIRAGDETLYQRAAPQLQKPVIGGATRQESALAGLEALAESPPDFVLIHDAARPYVSEALITRLLAAVESEQAACPAIPASDTIRLIEGETTSRPLPRAQLRQMQTPQAFPFAALLAAHRKATGQEFTDDAGLFEWAGGKILLVEGEVTNRKLTYAEDFLPAAPNIRTGTGFDVHQFGAGAFIMLGGVKIPHDKGITGHSDGDAALHALTDAILGALAAGDIGQHFPSSDSRWKNAPSEIFLRHAHDLLQQRGGTLINADITVICQRPALAPHREAIRRNIAGLLDVGIERISFKATTTDGLGFTGRGEGIAAQAAVSVLL